MMVWVVVWGGWRFDGGGGGGGWRIWGCWRWRECINDIEIYRIRNRKIICSVFYNLLLCYMYLRGM